MRRGWIVAVAAGILLSIGSLTTAMADEGGWKYDSGGWWYQYEDGDSPRNCWKEIDGNRYYFDQNCYAAVGWMKIKGYYYCFDETGVQKLGWRYYEDEDKWYYFKEDGSVQKGWFQDQDGSWYWLGVRGEMMKSGYRNINGVRYYFYEDGKMAANQYAGTYYMNEYGQHNGDYDMVIEGKIKESALNTEAREAITKALKDIPPEWIRRFVDQGWEFLYYPERSYFEAPDSGGSIYYVYHKLDTSYRKIKFCKPEALTQAFGEYIGYMSDCYDDDSLAMRDLFMCQANVDEFINLPDYYADDSKFYFGKLVEAYLDPEKNVEMEAASPEACQILKDILYSKDGEKSE